MVNEEQELLERVRNERETGVAVDTTLKTNAQVFARITDGIYREPASALRELIANAYDADATEVRIDTDAPRFSQISVRDNGTGLSESALVHVLSNIGGSLKRSTAGANYNVTSPEDRTLSPGQRKLIGKLGIGLFSVSQLTHHLVIVTKIRGENVRRVCDIMLMPQRDRDDIDDAAEFITGTARITTIRALDIETHGTDITLHNVREYVRSELRSDKTWEKIRIAAEREAALERVRSGGALPEDLELVEAINAEEDDDGFTADARTPLYHVGQVSHTDAETLVEPSALPWKPTDEPLLRFQKLVDGVFNLSPGASKEKTKITEVLDNYFRMLWTISLCVPLPYIQKHPFALSASDGVSVFGISNKAKGAATPLELENGATVGSEFGLSINEVSDFRVLIDGTELRRPIVIPPPSVDGESPLLFVGKLSSDLASLPKDFSGGPLEFQAYLCWTKRVVPAEHNGVMIRVHGASGILFDEHFLKYQVSEQTRLRQITAEVFITKGLDAAQNIDRESFNVSHPHYQILANWIHHALRLLNNKHKLLQRNRLDTSASESYVKAEQQLKSIVSAASPSGRNPNPASVKFFDKAADEIESSGDIIALDRSAVFSSASIKKPITRSEKRKASLFESQIVAVTSVLSDFGLLSSLDRGTRESLIKAIVEIFSVDAKK